MRTTTAGLVTVGDELLAGDIENTNATWLAARLDDRGVDVRQIRVVPDVVGEIASTVEELAGRFDAVVVTGGLGSTPDDVTLEGVATALGRPLETNEEALALLEETVAEVRRRRPELSFDMAAAARYPRDAEIIPNDEGIAPGCRCESVVVAPGIPDEMKAVFGRVEDRFNGSKRARLVYSSVPESNLRGVLDEVRAEFDVGVGCYPGRRFKRIKLTGDDPERLEAARGWLLERAEIVPEPDDE